MGTTESLTIAQLLMHHCESKCADARDRVYGLIGLASDCQHGEIQVDYSKSTQELYDQVIAFCAKNLSENMRKFRFHLRQLIA